MPSSFAIFKRGSRQYRVEQGEKIVVDYQKSAKPGDTIEFDEVLQLIDGKTVKIGQPTVKGARVVARVIDHVKDDKVIAYKYIKRKDSHHIRGHREKYTLVEITGINAK